MSSPDPNCPDCKGSGKIQLFTSDESCSCVNKGVVSRVLNIPLLDTSLFIKSAHQLVDGFRMKLCRHGYTLQGSEHRVLAHAVERGLINGDARLTWDDRGGTVSVYNTKLGTIALVPLKTKVYQRKFWINQRVEDHRGRLGNIIDVDVTVGDGHIYHVKLDTDIAAAGTWYREDMLKEYV